VANALNRVRQDDVGFVMEFHLPYVALRRGARVSDARGLRNSRDMLRTPGDSAEDGVLYEAQISLLLVGVDEWYWTAYCCVETYFNSERSTEWYHENHRDAPSGGGKMDFHPVWNPREYFLLVLSRRMNQITMEWQHIVTSLDKTLDLYVRHYLSQILEMTTDRLPGEKVQRKPSTGKRFFCGRR